MDRSTRYYRKNRKAIQEKNKQRARDNTHKRIERLYGLTPDRHAALLQTQDSCCRICHKRQGDECSRLVVDHDHSTGIVRGLLCDKCNTGLGLFGDSLANLASAIEYLTGEVA